MSIGAEQLVRIVEEEGPNNRPFFLFYLPGIILDDASIIPSFPNPRAFWNGFISGD
jgi:hypothetical protein